MTIWCALRLHKWFYWPDHALMERACKAVMLPEADRIARNRATGLKTLPWSAYLSVYGTRSLQRLNLEDRDPLAYGLFGQLLKMDRSCLICGKVDMRLRRQVEAIEGEMKRRRNAIQRIEQLRLGAGDAPTGALSLIQGGELSISDEHKYR